MSDEPKKPDVVSPRYPFVFGGGPRKSSRAAFGIIATLGIAIAVIAFIELLDGASRTRPPK